MHIRLFGFLPPKLYSAAAYCDFFLSLEVLSVILHIDIKT